MTGSTINTISTTTTTITTSSPPSFLSLPPEIRIEIYSLLLCLAPYSRYQPTPTYIHPNLLLTNRLINREATPFLYANNTFLAHHHLLASFPRLRAWYPPLREALVIPRIRRFHLELRLDCDIPYDCDAAAAAFSGLEELSINVIQSVYLGAGHANLTVFEKVRAVERATIFGSTTGVEDYVAWLRLTMQSPTSANTEDLKPAPGVTALWLNIFH